MKIKKIWNHQLDMHIKQQNTLFMLSGRQGRKCFKHDVPAHDDSGDGDEDFDPTLQDTLSLPFTGVNPGRCLSLYPLPASVKRQEDWSTPRSRTSIEKLFPKSWVLRSKAFQALTGDMNPYPNDLSTRIKLAALHLSVVWKARVYDSKYTMFKPSWPWPGWP